jgi:hypothetical protein
MQSASISQRIPAGLRCGVFVATGVALWFALEGTLHGAPLAGFVVYGSALLRMAGLSLGSYSPIAIASAYLVAHFAIFAAFGFIIEWVIREARREPTMLAGLLLVSVVAEALFAAIVVTLGIAFITLGSRAGMITMNQLLAGNLIGFALTFVWLWRHHPELHGDAGRLLAENGLSGRNDSE